MDIIAHFVCHDQSCDVVVPKEKLPLLPRGVRVQIGWIGPGDPVPFLDDGFQGIRGDPKGTQVLVKDSHHAGFYRDGIKVCCGLFGSVENCGKAPYEASYPAPFLPPTPAVGAQTVAEANIGMNLHKKIMERLGVWNGPISPEELFERQLAYNKIQKEMAGLA